MTDFCCTGDYDCTAYSHIEGCFSDGLWRYWVALERFNNVVYLAKLRAREMELDVYVARANRRYDWVLSELA